MIESTFLYLKKRYKDLNFQFFVDLIENIFTNKTNRVFTEVGLTPAYDMLIGIDQGEVISPLLWYIYYDPLLCEIEKLNVGYALQHYYRKDINDKSESFLCEFISDLAYMDDTTWITDDQE